MIWASTIRAKFRRALKTLEAQYPQGFQHDQHPEITHTFPRRACIRKGLIRQFVAMPLGEGYTAEEQLTGQAEHGGIQFIVYPMRKETFERLHAQRARVQLDAPMHVGCASYHLDMGLAPGGMIRQQIHDDPYGLKAWDTNTMSRCFVHLANSQTWHAITGEAPPSSPVTKETYEELGFPWFDFYFSDGDALEGSAALAQLDSVAAKSIKKGLSAEQFTAPVVIGKTIVRIPGEFDR